MNNVVSITAGPKVQLCEPDVEMALVGSLFMSPNAFRFYAEEISQEWFSDQLLGIMFDAGKRSHEAGHKTTAVGIISSLPQSVEGVSRDKLFARACGAAVPVDSISGLIEILKDRWARREILHEAEIIKGAADDQGVSPYDVISDSILTFDTINAAKNERHSGLLKSGIDQLLYAIENPDRMRGVTTGIADLDDKLNGYKSGMLYVVAGRPGMGKSAFMCSSMRMVAEAGHGVAIFSLEMGVEEILARCISDMLSGKVTVPYGDILKGQLSAFHRNRIREASERIETLPIHVDASPRLTVSEIAASARKTKAAFDAQGLRLRVLCVDHMGLVQPSGRYSGNKVAETSEVSNGLRALAKELDCCVVMLSQLSRHVESREDKRPIMSDLRWSGEIEQDAHVIAFLYRAEYYLAQSKDADEYDLKNAANRMEFLVRKNRNGATVDINLHCNISHSAVRGEG